MRRRAVNIHARKGRVPLTNRRLARSLALTLSLALDGLLVLKVDGEIKFKNNS